MISFQHRFSATFLYILFSAGLVFGQNPTELPFDLALQQWANFQEIRSDSLSGLFLPKALKLDAQGNLLAGREVIEHWYTEHPLNIGTVKSFPRIQADSNPSVFYEIGTIEGESKKNYSYLLLWNVRDNFPLREFECIAENDADIPLLPVINVRRMDWIRLCNAHDAVRLVDELYAENAVYYNHKPVLRGRKAIAAAYAYMNNAQYNLRLEPILVHPVRKDLVFEIGQCTGSYEGQYVLIWKRNTRGKWEILFDSNI